MLTYKTYKTDDNLPWVCFIHGAGGSSTIWFKQIRAFRKEYNVLLVDLRGHGNSQKIIDKHSTKKYSFKILTDDILTVLDKEKIATAHFVGISLGTIMIRQLAEDYPERVTSMILGGAVFKMNVKASFLIKLGNVFKNLVPYLLLYKFFAFILMPTKNNRNSRSMFINDAKKMCGDEFLKWYKLTASINPILMLFRAHELSIPTLYVMGENDHMFLPSIQQMFKKETFHSELLVIENCGHVVNVEAPDKFNTSVLNFLRKI